ncbi:hypothetical protein [Longimicrobium terrae]|uniref:Uncharacterized protein n=1 Tax=Longimicrobium terrae TaxID=1639882 RepID=A0A841GS28_9BACT|nr:hypothetical protein [Longimicrobium terrae]MBB4635616.1 hypothetical protein [Longimicrobium terrae]MBB6070010.1 hypothetical protein [Longimicrobium terrae]NNC32920.1 hypothetical protein [Longimicrobium terrae]
MELPVNDDLRGICREILDEGKTDEEWNEMAASDWFQTDSVHGGYEGVEDGFTFSYYSPQGEELWFQLTLAAVAEVAAGTRTSVEARPAG